MRRLPSRQKPRFLSGRGYKFFRRNHKGQLCFLFKSFQGSSVVPLGVWLKTKRPWVSDGGRQRKYRSGFHFLREHARVVRFDRLTKGKYVALPVQVRNAEPKPRSSVGSWLASEILVPRRTVSRVLTNR